MEGLAPIDGWVLAAILAKATGYALALLAMGGPVFLVLFGDAPEELKRLTRRIAVAAAALALTVLALRFGIRAARISGLGMAGVTDTVMLGLIWDGPLGSAAVWRAAGVVLVLALVSDGAVARGLGLLGAILIAISYTAVGHTLGDPRWLLAGALSVHLLGAGVWFAALAPLYRVSVDRKGAALLHRFGQVAGVFVAVLVCAGLTLAIVLTGSLTGLVTTAYGWILLFKLSFVTALLGLAAFNKWRLVPALSAGDLLAGSRLRRSIRWEAAIMAAIFLMTSTLTVVTTPPITL